MKEQQIAPPASKPENDGAGGGRHATNPAHWRVVSSGVLVLLLAVPAFSQTPGSDLGDAQDGTFGESLLFQEIPSVFGASKYEQKVTEAPSSVSIITAEEIRRYGYRTLADVLRNARGFYTTNDRNFSYAGVRGFGRPADFNSRLLVLVDGFRTNDGVYNSAGIGLEFPIDVDLIERVEIARGPSSSLYGTSAFFGVVNVITKSGRQMSGAQVSGSLGSFGTGYGRMDYGGRFSNGLDVLLSSTLSDSAGQDLFFPEFLDVNDGVAVGADYERSQNLFGKMSVNDFTVHGSYLSRTKGIPTASYETAFNTPDTFTTDGSMRVGVTYDHRFNTGVVLTSRVGYDNIYEDGEYIYDWAEEEGDPEDLVANIDRYQTQRVTSEVTLTKQVTARHRVVAGSEYRNNFVLHQKNFDREVYQDDTRDSYVFGVYAQDEFSLTDNLILNAGLRYDTYGFDTTTSNVSPRVAAIYSPVDDTTLKVLYGTAFRAPSTYELYFDDASFNKAALTLNPERMRSTEVVVEQVIGAAWQLTGSVYQYSIDDLITPTFDPADGFYVSSNVERIEASGLETEVEGKTQSGWTGRAGYGLQRTREFPGNLALSNSPTHMVKLNFIAPLLDSKVFAGVEALYMSARRTLAASETSGAFLTNLTLSSATLPGGWDLSFSAYNLFDQRYWDPGSGEHLQDRILQDGRSFRLKLGYRFGARRP